MAKPDGLLVVPHKGEFAFLHPLPVERLWGVGAVTAGRLRARGMTTVDSHADSDHLGHAAAPAARSHADGRVRGPVLIGVALSNLDNDGTLQLTLPFDGHDTSVLDSALDNVRDRFGSTSITRATLLGHHEGPTVPLLPG